MPCQKVACKLCKAESSLRKVVLNSTEFFDMKRKLYFRLRLGPQATHCTWQNYLRTFLTLMEVDKMLKDNTNYHLAATNSVRPIPPELDYYKRYKQKQHCHQAYATANSIPPHNHRHLITPLIRHQAPLHHWLDSCQFYSFSFYN